jgi:uncharacterized protein YjbJ (UPF0337 family)
LSAASASAAIFTNPITHRALLREPSIYAIEEVQMSEQDKSGQARKSLIDSVKGKAKEVVGALTKSDSLTAEGQLEQTEAKARREANRAETVADAEAEKARAEVAEAQREGTKARTAVNAETRAAETTVRNDQAAQKRAAEQAAQREAERKKTRADLDTQLEVQHAKDVEREEIDAATEEAVDAAAEHQSSVQAADSAKAEADRIRRQADNMTNEADLP